MRLGPFPRWRIAAVATHPIQYQAPLWRAIAASGTIGLKVFFVSRHGLDVAVDPGFGLAFAWDVSLLDGYEYEFLPSLSFPFFKGPVANRYPKGLARRFKEGRFDAVLVFGYATGAAWAGMWAAWQVGIPVIMRGDTHDRGRSQTLRSQIKRILLPRLLRRIDGFLAIGTWNREYWERYGVPSAKIETAIHAVDNGWFGSQARERVDEALSLRATWGVPPDGTVFLYRGKLIPSRLQTYS
jgi:hypothetical protein